MNKCLTIIRGASGSGKSWLASAIREQSAGAIWLASDDYRTDEWGNYHYSPDTNAHVFDALENDTEYYMKENTPHIIIEATFVRPNYMTRFTALVVKYRYELQEILIRRWPLLPNKHNVPENIRKSMQNKIEL